MLRKESSLRRSLLIADTNVTCRSARHTVSLIDASSRHLQPQRWRATDRMTMAEAAQLGPGQGKHHTQLPSPLSSLLCYNFARTICHYVFESVKSTGWKRR
jgi:hypothetical protein